jgi:ABC transporter substrate binding protein
MDRREFIGTLAGGLLAAPLATEAQQAAKVPRIGYLVPNLTVNPHLHEAFRQGLRDLGYVEGGNLVIEYRDAEGKLERLPALAAELVALKVDVIVVPSTPAALAAKHATRTLPILFASAADPVTSGLVTSLARPGGNVTWSSILAPELVGKCLEQLKQAVPGVSRVAVLWQPGAVGERIGSLSAPTRRGVRLRGPIGSGRVDGGADLACHQVEDLKHLAQIVSAEVDGDVAQAELLVAREMVDHRLRPLSQELVAEREAY